MFSFIFQFIRTIVGSYVSFRETKCFYFAVFRLDRRRLRRFFRYNTSVDGGMSPQRNQSDSLSRRHSDFSSFKVDSIQTPRYGDGNFEECRAPLQLWKVQAGSIANISVSRVGLGCDTHESISCPGQERSNFSISIKSDTVSGSQSFGCNDPAVKVKFCVNGSSTVSSSFTPNTNANIFQGPRSNFNEFRGTSILRSGRFLALVELAYEERSKLIISASESGLGHGCITVGMGSPVEKPVNQRVVVQRGPNSSYQFSGINNS